LEKANTYINKIKADLGGTEILKPLEFIFKQNPNQEFQRCVFLLTGKLSFSNILHNNRWRSIKCK
jgi:hypothetical protein